MGILNQTCLKNTSMNHEQKNSIQSPIQVDPVNQTKLVPPSKPVISQGMQRVGKHGKSHHEYLKIMNTHEQTKNFRPISIQQLSQHNTTQSAWISLNGVVYDVTVYLDYHPGGHILLQGCGKESTGLFNKYHPWVNAKYLLEKYQIGYLK